MSEIIQFLSNRGYNHIFQIIKKYVTNSQCYVEDVINQYLQRFFGLKDKFCIKKDYNIYLYNLRWYIRTSYTKDFSYLNSNNRINFSQAITGIYSKSYIGEFRYGDPKLSIFLGKRLNHFIFFKGFYRISLFAFKWNKDLQLLTCHIKCPWYTPCFLLSLTQDYMEKVFYDKEIGYELIYYTKIKQQYYGKTIREIHNSLYQLLIVNPNAVDVDENNIIINYGYDNYKVDVKYLSTPIEKSSNEDIFEYLNFQIKPNRICYKITELNCSYVIND
jgi:hypothetical protein